MSAGRWGREVGFRAKGANPINNCTYILIFKFKTDTRKLK